MSTQVGHTDRASRPIFDSRAKDKSTSEGAACTSPQMQKILSGALEDEEDGTQASDPKEIRKVFHQIVAALMKPPGMNNGL